MIYKEFKGLKLSALGLGCMRFPVIPDSDGVVDEDMTAEMVKYAIEHGINYFDTAFMYHKGKSEEIIGKILANYPRDSFYLATKFPGFSPEQLGKPAEIFEQQLKNCGVSYFDFYLLHSVTDNNIDGYLSEEYNIIPYFIEQKRAGRIRHLGFSSHCSIATIKRMLDAYGEELEFCQIQLNYLDWNMQNAKGKVALLKEYGVPVWVMEPVRGGRLVDIPAEDYDTLQTLRPDVSTPEWAFRFLQSVDGVTMVLSGMSNMQQLQENVRTFEEYKPLNSEEWKAILLIADKMIRKNAVPCTGCSYCTERCPQGLNIPGIIKAYNEYNEKKVQPEIPGPADCLNCKNCEIVCPQGIVISDIMESFAEML